MRIRSWLVVVLAGVAAVSLASAPAWAVDGPLPRMGDRGEVDGAPDGLSVTPAVVEVRVPPGRRVPVGHVLANRTGSTLQLEVDALPVPSSPDGPEVAALPVEAQPPLTDRAPFRLVPPASAVRLEDGHGAELWSTVEAMAGVSGVMALRARVPQRSGEGADRAEAEHDRGVVAYVVVADEGLSDDLAVHVDTDVAGAGELATVRLDAARHLVADVRVRVHSWAGVVADRTIRDLVVDPGPGRAVVVDRPARLLPGRVTVEVVAVTRTGEEARATGRVGLGLTAPAAATLLLVVAGGLALRALRRRRLRSAG
jgi:hypothetical protein